MGEKFDSHHVGESTMCTLSCWGGGWGLPSLDPDSIQCLAAVRFAGVPAKVVECNNPWKSPNGSIPFFKKKDEKYLYTSGDIASYLRSKNYSSDYGLTTKQCAEVFAYVQYINEALHPALQYFLWADETNFNEVIRPFYGRKLPWVYKMWYPERLKKRACKLLSTIYPDSVMKPSVCEPYVLLKARSCVTYLSDKLGTNEFFTSLNLPTTIDAVIFSYLAIFIKVPLPNNPIREFIKSTPNLERYIARISLRYFPATSGGVAGLSESSRVVYGHDGEVVVSEESGFPPGQKILAFVIATCAMLMYAMRIGIIKSPSQIQALTAPVEEGEEEYWDEN